MSPVELAWLAGWLEGEGCFFYSETKSNSPKIMIQVYSTDLDIIQRAAVLMLAKRVRVMPPRKANAAGNGKSNGGFRTEIQADAAANLMRELLPMMGKRRSEKIREALDGWNSRPSRPMIKPCACGCGKTIFAGRRTLYASRTGSCAMRAFRARQKEIAA